VITVHSPESQTSFHIKALKRKKSLSLIFLARFAPLRDQLLSCFLLILTISLIVVSTSQATTTFSKLEKQALLEYARGCLTAQLSATASPQPPEFATRQQRACFVTFFNGKRVFACFGGFSPRRANLAEEISENIRLALKNDGRARLATREMASQAGVQITFPLGQPERVISYQSINPAREGMFVESANAGVAFVPGEARTAAWAFREALRRLNINDPTAVSVYRFQAESLSTRNHP
jgi:hypothetical protein